jgi:transposase InsO family protein
LIKWIGIGRGKFYEWLKRYGKVNEHNSWIPRDFWVEEWEKKVIIDFHWEHPTEGYRRLTYMMLDKSLVAVSPSTTYRVLRAVGLIQRWNNKPSKKGTGFVQPLKPHEHWHIDISYINICSTFYYLCSLLDGCSRYIVHWEIRESMTEGDVEIVIQRARERFPDEKPRVISDNGPQFIAGDFKEYIRVSGMTHVRTSPFYPQSNGKIERWHKSLKSECIRPKTPLSVENAREVVKGYVDHYNNVRLHSALCYIAPKDKIEGREKEIFSEREKKLVEARERRKISRQKERKLGTENTDISLTEPKERAIMQSAGETEMGNAGEQPIRDSRSGGDE